MLWIFENAIFTIFANFWAAKSTKLFSGKVRQSIQNYLNQNLVIGIFLENGFGASLSSKTSVVSVWKRHFTIFLKCLSDQVETIFWQSEAKCSNLFKSNFGHGKLLRKWFWRYIKLKNQCSGRLKRAFSVFCRFFIDEVKTSFWESEAKRSKLLKSKFGHRKLLRKWFWSNLSCKTNVFSI